MQRGCLKRNGRKRGPDVWQFRWSENGPDGKRVYHKKMIGTVEAYADENAARRAVVGLVSEINPAPLRMNSVAMTVAQLCDHFEQRELAKENVWRSHATKKIYRQYLSRWIRPHWQKYQLGQIRTIQVESWLRGLPLAKSTCAKIRSLMSVLFNHACRYELFDRNPIHLVRQSAKRRTAPTVLMPSEIKALVDALALRERTLVLLAASTGLRQSELFGLKWGDIDFAQGTMSVTRSIVYGVAGPCKTESSQKPVPIHPLLTDTLLKWKECGAYTKPNDWVFASKRYRGRRPYWGSGNLTPIHSSCGVAGRNPEAIRMAYFPAHILDPAAECRDGIQSNAGADAAFLSAIDVGRLHAGSHAGKACSTGGCDVVSIFLRYEDTTIRCWTSYCCHIATVTSMRVHSVKQKGHKRGAERAFFVPLMVL